ncbi:MAG: phospho-N-acetylmuramoyl-pentapeptide-transferase [Planctomycetota bacterium]
MIYHLLRPYAAEWNLANLVTYISVRAAAAALLAFIAALFVGPAIIRWLRSRGWIEPIIKSDSDVVRASAEAKKGTPTMGGFIILAAILIALGVFGNFSNVYVLLAYCAAAGFGVIGFADDYIKLAYADRKGLRALAKIILQGGVAFALAVGLFKLVVAAGDGLEGNPWLVLKPPFFKDWGIDLSVAGGLLYVGLATLVVVATSNGVNLSDGLDGLASGCVVLAALAMAFLAYVAGRVDWCSYLHLPHVPGCGELAVVMAALAGGALGFLWFNAFPAEVFMGDTGSLMLGGLIGYVAVVARHELTLLIVGGIFLAESVSVILQVGSYKLRRRRVFLQAPIHHHFQKRGWHEVKVTTRFWIIGAILALLGMATVKIR